MCFTTRRSLLWPQSPWSTFVSRSSPPDVIQSLRLPLTLVTTKKIRSCLTKVQSTEASLDQCSIGHTTMSETPSTISKYQTQKRHLVQSMVHTTNLTRMESSVQESKSAETTSLSERQLQSCQHMRHKKFFSSTGRPSSIRTGRSHWSTRRRATSTRSSSLQMKRASVLSRSRWERSKSHKSVISSPVAMVRKELVEWPIAKKTYLSRLRV